MIAVFTDFGLEGPYMGQMRAAILARDPSLCVVDLMSDAPAFEVQLCAYLLPALARDFPDGTVFLSVVDPGVGGERPPVILRTDRQIFVGPGNGLFEILHRRAAQASLEEILWRPSRLSASFHGRDLFAPVAARLARGEVVPTRPARVSDSGPEERWPDDLDRILYVDRYGNAMTGRRASHLDQSAILSVNGRELRRAKVFHELPEGEPFWYENSSGLVELAANRGRADRILHLSIGSKIDVIQTDHH